MLKRDFSDKELTELFKKNEAFWHKLDAESDLGVVLSTSAYFEEKLRVCILRYLRSGRVSEQLLEPQSPLGSFRARNDCALCLRIIDEHQHNSLRKLASIRNRFAHDLLASFEDGPIRDKVDDFVASHISHRVRDEMKACDMHSQPRHAFTLTAFSLGMELSHREIDVWMHTRDYGEIIPDHLDEVIRQEAKGQ